MKPSWDIFCRVVDNFGDIGVCWRLARQLAAEHGLAVRLWVDDLAPFARFCPAINIGQDIQTVAGVSVCRWCDPFPDVVPGDVVVEAFAGEIPRSFQLGMTQRSSAPAWINLEYLSAESWVAGTHGLPSPQSNLTKYFFFPGFVAGTGGLLRERDLISARDKFQRDKTALAEFWHSLGLTSPRGDELRVSLFCYENRALETLLRQWADGSSQVTCLVPEGVAATALSGFFDTPSIATNSTYAAGNLRVQAIPFLQQDDYDRLLWACDVNFVRGEDSFVRAQWAARPFVWQIYPQDENAHHIKLEAFLDLFCADMPTAMATRLCTFWRAWNGADFAPAAWDEWLESRAYIGSQTNSWAETLARQADLATTLVNFTSDLLK